MATFVPSTFVLCFAPASSKELPAIYGCFLWQKQQPKTRPSVPHTITSETQAIGLHSILPFLTLHSYIILLNADVNIFHLRQPRSSASQKIDLPSKVRSSRNSSSGRAHQWVRFLELPVSAGPSLR